MTTILIFFGILAFLVVAHELGHFTVAKLARVRVLEFGVGLPPKVFSLTRGETTYSLNLLPIGGFVRMLGEEDPTHPASFAAQSAWKRLAILAAGPLMNAVLPILLITVMLMLPRDVPITDVVILRAETDSPAAAAGLRPGDIIREVDGRGLDNSTDLVTAIQRRVGAESTWVIDRAGRAVETTLVPRVDPPSGQGAAGIVITDARVTVASVAARSPAADVGLARGDLLLSVQSTAVDESGQRRVPGRRILNDGDLLAGVAAAWEVAPDAPVELSVLRGANVVALSIAPPVELSGYTLDVRPSKRASMPVWRAFPASFIQTWDILVIFRNEISKWMAGSGPVQISGPVGIAQITGEVAEAGLSPLILWTALLSINLAIVNFLPIPALDGGRITFVLLELARGGRRLAPDKERIVHMVGFALLMAAIAVISINDIQRLISGTTIGG